MVALVPAPRACHPAPSQLAILLAMALPAVAKLPPTINCGRRELEPSGSHEASDSTCGDVGPPATPAPSGCQATPSQRATPFTAVSPEVVKYPPAISWDGCGPGP